MIGDKTQSDTRVTPPARSTRHEQRVTQWLLGIITVILVAWGLKAAASVLVPLAFAMFLTAVFWPLQRRLQRRLARSLSTAITLLSFLVVVGLFVGALWLSGNIIAQTWPQYSDQLQGYVNQIRSWAQNYGLSIPGGTAADASGQAGSGSTQQALFRGADRLFSFGAAFVLVTAFLIFGLLEVLDFRTKLDQVLPHGKSARWMDSIHKITSDFQRYIVVRTVIGLITGTLVALFAWILGLDLAFIWGLINFLLNYIPTLGSIIAVIPPVLFALLQFQDVTMALLVLLGVGGVQLIMGTYIDPWLQGKYLALSSLVVLFSVTFWGWIWGIAGAFISVPLTILVVIACNQFDRTRWIATLLTDVKESEDTANDET